MKLFDNKAKISMKMKTKLTSVTYFGYTAMDRRFSNAMLPWLLREIRSANIRDKLSIAVEDGCLKAYNGNFEPIIIHRLVDIIRASQVPGRPEELFYIVLNENEGLLNCYMFSGKTADEVTDLFVQMRDPSPASRGSATSLNGSVTKNHSFQQHNSSEHLPWSNPAISVPGNCNNLSETQSPLVRSVSNASALTTLCADLSLSDSHFFEVLYIGKVRISQRKVPESLIDDALNKFAQHEAEKARNQRRHSLLSSTGTSIYSNDSAENLNEEKRADSNDKINRNVNLAPSNTPLEPDKANTWSSAENLSNKTKDIKEVDEEFDVFSKERVEKEPRKGSQIPLEPTVVVLNVTSTTKNSLSTLEEDEEKNEDLHSMISETATSITQFCQKVQREDSDEYKDNNKDKTESTTEIEKAEVRNNLEEENEKKELNIEKKIITEGSPASNVSFPEIQTKPRALLRSKTGLDNFEKRSNIMPENKPFLRDRSASIGTLNLKTPMAQVIGEQNRTMLFQVGRSDLRLISPDRKQILLHRAFKDVASCVMGRQNKNHFGFVCRETTESYACYVFKCESDSVATEVVNAIKQAFLSHSDLVKKSREKSPNMTCEHCPMLWYHRLCHDIEGMNDKKTYMFILRRLGQLPVEEQDLIVTKYQGGATHIVEERDHNVFLMMLLRAHCEGKQQRHQHDTVENRSEFLNQYLGSSTIFMKAKRSLSTGFDNLLKRRSSKDDGNVLVPVKKESSPLPVQSSESTKTSPELLSPDPNRAKSMSPAGVPDYSDPPPSPRPIIPAASEEEEENSPNSPMMDIFLKVSDNRPVNVESGAEPEATWRQVIYEKVIQPPDADTTGRPPIRQGKRTKEQLRELWKMAIDQTILLVRMEKENAKLREGEENSAVRRIKLEYSELGVCDAGVTLMWDSLLSRNSSQPMAKVDRHMLTQAVIQGVPRQTRGAVWYFLAEQAALRGPSAPPSARACPRYHQPYRALIADLTKHHHSILIDLGRTFPQHSYFASALGPGQLALYNILKAYSLLDPEVGYCQGLSFVAGVLLLHMEEGDAFVLLRHLMFRRGLRKQYLPDMSALQVQMYQLSRLVRDHEPELHARLAALDIAPALYAAPWMLTLFTSQFPLGFVVRVYDLIFLDSLDVIFSVSLALLAVHRDGLMLCESCEEAAEYLKHKLPDMDKGIFDKVMKKVHTLDISRQLADYAVEYAVLREEMPRLATLTDDNRRLIADNSRMSEELDSAMTSIENYQATQSRVETQNKLLEQQITLLSRYISAHHKQDMPIEIKKIVHNYSKKLSFSSKISSFSSKFTSNEDEEDLRKNLKSGTSAPNLFAKISKEDLLNAVNKEKNRTEDKRFMMKKSQSVHSGLISNNVRHYPLKVLDEKAESENFKTDIITESLKELGKKNSGFFANTHEQIRQERFFEQQLKLDFDKNLKKLDEKLGTEETDDVSIFQGRKSMSLNLKPSMKDSKFNDSGFVTPLSPNDREERKEDSVSIISHPLSDVDVDIKFDGQSTKLKQIRPVRHNNDSVESK